MQCQATRCKLTAAIVIVAVLAALGILHPYTTYPLSLTIVRRLRGSVGFVQTLPPPARFALVCCAYNEVKVIRQKIANSLAIRERLGDCQILFYSDASSDGTSEALIEAGPAIVAVIGEQRAGKTAGMNRLLALTDADVVIFSDANVHIDVNKITNIIPYFCDPKVGMVGGRPFVVNGDATMTAEVGTAYRDFEEVIKELETDTGSMVHTDGTLFALRRNAYVPVPPNLTDDFFTALMVMIQGYRNVAADFDAYEPAATVRRDELRRRVRMACHGFNCHLALWPKLRNLDGLTIYKYASHKLIRWFCGYFMGTLAVGFLALIGLHLGLLWAAAAAALGIGITVLSSRVHIPVVSRVVEVVMISFAVAYGVALSISGETFQTWTIASSARDPQGRPTGSAN